MSTVEDLQRKYRSPVSTVTLIVLCLPWKTFSVNSRRPVSTVTLIVLFLPWKTFSVNSRRPVCVYRRRLSVQVLYLCLLWLETVSVQYRIVGSASSSQGRRPDSQMLGILNVNVKYLLLLSIPPISLTSSPLPLSWPR